MTSNNNTIFNLIPHDGSSRLQPAQQNRSEILDFWNIKFGISGENFNNYTFWEKGSGKIWAFGNHLSDGLPVEAIGIRFLTTKQTNWKPTTRAVQLFGNKATKNTITLPIDQVLKFIQGETIDINWNGDRGYVIVKGDLFGDIISIGVGIYSNEKLISQIPKSSWINPLKTTFNLQFLF